MTTDVILTAVVLIGMISISGLMIVGVVRGVLRRKREADELKERVRAAIEDITADGIVEGPKGRYVPHRAWDAGIGSGTSGETRPPSNPGPYGMQPPKV